MTAATATAADLVIEGELTIFRAAELRQWLDERVPHTGTAMLRLDAVTEVDTAGVQLLLAGRRLAAERGSQLVCAQPSAPVLRLLQLLRLEADLGLDTPPATEPQTKEA